MSSLAISATGIHDSMLRMDAATNNIAVANVGPPTPVSEVSSESLPNNGGVKSIVQTRESVFGVDLVSEALNLKLASNSFSANAKAMQASNASIGTIINLFDTGKK